MNYELISTKYLRDNALRIKRFYEDNEKKFMINKTIIIYGSYSKKHPEGIRFLKYLQRRLRRKGYLNTYIVKDLGNRKLGIRLSKNLNENIRSLIRSIQSLCISDVPIFIFSEAILGYASGVVIELSLYSALLTYMVDVPRPWYALVLINSNVWDHLSSLIKGIIELHKIPNRLYDSKEEAYEAIISHIDNVIYKMKQEIIPFT